MHSFKDKRSLPYAAEFINNIVLDIEKYPEFLPWCTKAIILNKLENEHIAELTINFKAFSESYKSRIITSENTDAYIINVEAISGPFKKMTNIWEIKKLNEGCEVNFSIDFTFKSIFIDAIIGSVFSLTTSKIINAFEIRAHNLSQNNK